MTDVKTRLINLFFVNGQLCLIEVFSNKLRSFISSFGIFLGVASLLILLSFMHALRKNVTDSIVAMGGLDIITITKLAPETNEEALAFRRSPGLKLTQALALQKEIPEITMVLPEASSGHAELTVPGKEAHANPVAVSLPYTDVFKYEIGSGRKFIQDDYDQAAKVCIIGSRIQERLFPDIPDPVGKSLLFNGMSFKIIGIIYTEDRWDWRSRTMLYPYPTYERYVGGQDNELGSIKIKVKTIDLLAQTKAAMTSRLISLHRGVEDFDIVLNEDKIKEMEDTQRALNILIVVIAVLSLFIGGVSIMNIMFATIGDRVREIGLRKALGAHKSDLFVQFLIESVLLCFVGAMPGMVFGSIPTFLPTELLPMTPSLSAADYLLSIGFTVFVGVGAGIFPAWKAANMRPIEALQYA